jgi:hypothetical protein
MENNLFTKETKAMFHLTAAATSMDILETATTMTTSLAMIAIMAKAKGDIQVEAQVREYAAALQPIVECGQRIAKIAESALEQFSDAELEAAFAKLEGHKQR